MNLPTGLVCHVEMPFKMLFSHNVLVPYEHNFSYLNLTGPTCFLQAHAEAFFFLLLCNRVINSTPLSQELLLNSFPRQNAHTLIFSTFFFNVQTSLYSFIYYNM